MLDPSERIIVLNGFETGHQIEAQLDKELTSHGGRAAWRIKSAVTVPYVMRANTIHFTTTVVVERKAD